MVNSIIHDILDKILPSGRSTSTGGWLIKLFVSIIIDLVGLLTYLVPGLGETVDVVWAPISAFLIYRLFGSGFFALLGFIEEALPGMDFIPTASIACIHERYNILGWLPYLTSRGRNSNNRSGRAR